MLRGVAAIVWEWDVTARRFTFVSEAMERLLGYPASLFLVDRHAWRRIVHPDDRDRVLALRQRMTDHLIVEYRAVAHNGAVRWLRDEVRRVTDADGALLRGVATDITDLKRAEEALRDSRDFYFSLFDDFPTMVWRSRADGYCDYFNQAWLRFSGTSLADELGDGWTRRVHDADREYALREWREAVASRQPFRCEYRLLHRSGEYRPVLDMGRPFHGPDGTYLGYAGTALDLSEQRALEQQLRQAQKMEAVGQLAGGIAHDFNNILTAIQGHAELALEQCGPGDPVGREIREIRQSASRAAGLTRQLLAFGRKQVLQPTVFAVADVVTEMTGMLKRLTPENIEFRVTRQARNVRVHADRSQFEQVLMNLVVNARDAMPDGGALTIGVDTLVVDGRGHPVHSFIPAGEYARLTVSDTGTGMDEHTLSRIFEPFFTTKEPGRGTGLGLAMAYGIVKQSGGFILAESEPGEGSTFEVLLARATAPEAPERERSVPADSLHGAESVLVVEDEHAVRRLMTRTLRSRGYTVFEAENAETAARLIHLARTPSALVTDVVLPGTSGVELARQLTAQLPGLRVLLTSGFPRDNFEGGLPPEWDFLEKPFTPFDLQLRLRQLLDSPRP
ncbi:MAG TPA: PAS domain-containing protein [Longimicrobiales bacterium]|nr:PAS domain-containing protein [Longimicrobiales bacterium]